MALAFLAIWIVSKMDNSPRAKIDRAGFPAQQVRSETGIGAEQPRRTEAGRRVACRPPPPEPRPAPSRPILSAASVGFISLMASRVRDAPRKPFYVDGGTDLVSLATASPSTAGPRRWCATVTGSASSQPPTFATRVVGVPPERSAASHIFEPLSVSADAELFDALIPMLRHGFHRLIVRDNDEIIGVLTSST